MAKELAEAGYTKPQVEKALAIHARMEADADRAIAAENARWRQQAEAALQPGDKEAIAAVMAGAPTEVRQLLARTGLGNHPALVRFIADLGRRIAGRRS